MEEEKPKYFIDTRWYDDHDRSFRTMAETRLCASCKKKLGTETQERIPTVDARGRVVFEVRSVPFANNPLSVIRSDCSMQRNYITNETPVVEAIFRVFLANGNQPADIDSIREQLAAYIPLGERPSGYSSETIERLIHSDHHYGLRELNVGAE